MELAKNLVINEKSPILMQSLPNLVKMTSWWKGKIDKISAWLVKNCGFFINDNVFGQFYFFLLSLYVEICKFFPHDFLQKFCQINFVTKELYCKSIWRKNFEVGEYIRS